MVVCLHGFLNPASWQGHRAYHCWVSIRDGGFGAACHPAGWLPVCLLAPPFITIILTHLLLGDLQGLEVVAHNSELLLELYNLGLSSLGTFLGSLQISLDHGQLTGNLLVFLVCLLGDQLGLSQLCLQDGHTVVLHVVLILKSLSYPLGLICGMAGLSKLLGGSSKTLLAPLQILFKQLDPPVQGSNLSLSLLAATDLHLELPGHVLRLLLVLLHLLLGLPHLL